MASTINFANHVKQLINTMRGMQRILYVGTDYRMEDYPALANLAWRCIFTSNQDPAFADIFNREDRQVRNIKTIAEYEREDTILDINNPMIVYLNGFTAESDDKDDIDLELEQEENREDLLEALKKLLTSGLTVDLLMVGYNPENKKEITPKELAKMSKSFNEQQITIYGLSVEKEADVYLRRLEEKGILTVFTQNLGDAIEKASIRYKEDIKDETEPVSDIPQKNDNSLYINGEIRSIDQRLIRDFNRYGRVLTLSEMKVRRIERMMEAEYFYKFLKKSPSEPQWYGYSKANGFSVKREFEDDLYNQVVNGLENIHNPTPVIIAGQSGSGKSIALASLAYRIFYERKYPVLFVNNPEYLRDLSNEQEKHAMDNILKELRDHNGRVLVILDWSIPNLQRSDRVRRIFDWFINRAQNVLFVVSVTLAQNKNYNVINVPKTLSEQEKAEFKELVIEKAKLQRNKVERWIKIHAVDNYLLSMLYRLIYELRPQLEKGIWKEITGSLEDTKLQIAELDAPKQLQQPLTELARKLYEHKLIEKRAEYSEEESKEFKNTIIDELYLFCEKVAVSSIFKLRMPMTLAMKLLSIPDDWDNRREYCDAVFNAPWINSAMDDDKFSPGEYYVEFREPTDALIYLNSIGMNESKRMEVVAEIISVIGEDKGPYYSEEVRFLERLIRMVGPNSDFDDIGRDWKNTYGQEATCIINALQNLRENGIIEPRLVAQEITYLREYYVQMYNNDPKCQIEHLIEAISIAHEVLEMWNEKDERTLGWQEGIIDSITVESVFSELKVLELARNIGAKDLYDEYRESISVATYMEHSEKLMPIIYRQPDNSYAYTALISSFLVHYNKELEQVEYNEMMENISDLLEIIDVTESSIPAVEENVYYQPKKWEFFEYIKRFKGSTRADVYFDKLLEMRSPVGIHMKARMILLNENISFNAELKGPKQEDACRRALAVLETPEYDKIVCNHAACQFMRLQLTWILCNEKPIFAKERQTTCMTKDEWDRVKRVCQSIKDNVSDQRTNRHYRATVYYILALACAQLGQYGAAIEIWRDVKEGDFYTPSRRRTWHVLSDPKGKPLLFSGTFNRPYLNDNTVFIREMDRSVRYDSLQSLNVSAARGDIPNLSIGTRYRGFVAFIMKAQQ